MTPDFFAPLLASPLAAPVALGMALLSFLTLVFYIIWTEVRLVRLFRDGKPANIETAIAALNGAATALEKRMSILDSRETKAEHALTRAIRGIGMVRFNAFQNAATGGAQSFAVALTNDRGDGVVISSIYSRERVNVYAKDLISFKSSYELSDEEEDAVNRAKQYAA